MRNSDHTTIKLHIEKNEKRGEINMKPRKAFYMENIEVIKELEDRLFDLAQKMEEECGKQDFKESLNLSWSLLYEICRDK